MDTAGLILVLVLLVVVVSLLIGLLRRPSFTVLQADLQRGFDGCGRETERIDRTVRDETQRLRADLQGALIQVIGDRLQSIDSAQERRLNAIREEMGHQRTEVSSSLERHATATGDRLGEHANRQEASSGALAVRVGQLQTALDGRFEALRATIDIKLGQIQDDGARKLDEMRATVAERLQMSDNAQDLRLNAIRDEMGQQRAGISISLERHATATGDRLNESAGRQQAASGSLGERVGQLQAALDGRFEVLRTTVDIKLAQIQDDSARKVDDMRATVADNLQTNDSAQDLRLRAIRDEMGAQRAEISSSLERHATATSDRLTENADRQEASSGSLGDRVVQLQTTLDGRFEVLRTTVDTKLAQIQDDSARKLDEMRATVAEKLQTTLERSLGESFTRVSQQLEQVQRGLGEMQSLSEGVGDLRRVMSNVKSRGTLGEWRLESILEQVMAPDQYAKNVQPIPGSGATVEFAIRIPQHGDRSSVTWLPVDSKFPIEDYERVMAAQDVADRSALDLARRDLAGAIRKAAKDIHAKYIGPPHTTDYGILFLPTEGLFAEVIRQPGLVEELHSEHRVMIAGPTTFATLLNCLQMGFRSVALAERSREVWSLLGAVRTEFPKFTEAMTAVKKRLEQAQRAVEGVEKRTRAMGRKLRTVELEPAEAGHLIESENVKGDEVWIGTGIAPEDLTVNAAA